MAEIMITAGYETECTQVFLVARRNALDATMQSLGYEKASIDDVVRMAWEGLESEIGTWIKAYRHILNAGLSAEHDLCVRVFVGRNAGLGRDIFADLARCAMLQMFNFTEAVAMTKRAAEKLFKVLDMYEAIRDGAPVVDGFVSTNKAEGGENSSGAEALADLKSELASVRSRLGESAAAIFCDLESSIRADAGKQPVPGGAVHPLTRYLMNYLKYACEYKNTLEQVFREFHRPDADDAPGHEGESNPFAAQLMEVMELLHGSLEAKSKLYKDLALSSIFLMNNGRYMLQKIRGSPEINAVVGEAWARKRSTDLRQYHKNYQRETWGRVLNVLRDDGGITVKGHVQKPVLKERFKQFNAAMDEIQRTQGAWVVSDEQLQSELRVSIAAVVVPAYRSFLGRFAQHFTAGRQTEKYIKLSADDLEGIIEELFEGSAGSMSRRRN
uniref:Exocyst subunit Exo70 family protein n=2 Tax=Triticum urartu TaxID=4572 RepID=A0A8R7Q0X0_TRIUA